MSTFNSPFRKLQERMEEKGLVLRQGESKLDEKSDDEVFSEAMADVREIKEFRSIPLRLRSRNASSSHAQDDSLDSLRRFIQGEGKVRLSDTAEYIEWVRSDLRKDIVLRLHEGAFSVQDSIDLHGMTLAQADEALMEFFSEAIRRRYFCVKVIHGRGLRSPKGPVLKTALKGLLDTRLRKKILAYSSARDCDGGVGATYIILRGTK
jgi:DNA-nicking Smr family endonuclease